ncbi:MAG: LamG domain-containing protein [Candidatus Omnitrophica bacterium]|nr:LamG domain-containing protein [Candidatus Omnitrophota bacterium]
MFVFKRAEYEKDVAYIKAKKALPSFAQKFYLSLWFKSESPEQMIIISEYSKKEYEYYEVWLNTEGGIYFVLTDGEGELEYQTDGINYKDGKWHYLALTKNQEDEIKIYVDGKKIFEKQTALSLDTNTEFVIGAGLADRGIYPYAQFEGFLKNISFAPIEIEEEDAEYEYLMVGRQ